MNRSKRVACNFKRLMDERGFSIKEIAELGNVGVSYVSKLLSQKIETSFGVEAEEKWAKIFQCDISEFYKNFEDKNDMNNLTTEEREMINILSEFNIKDPEVLRFMLKEYPKFRDNFENLWGVFGKMIKEKKIKPKE